MTKQNISHNVKYCPRKRSFYSRIRSMCRVLCLWPRDPTGRLDTRPREPFEDVKCLLMTGKRLPNWGLIYPTYGWECKHRHLFAVGGGKGKDSKKSLALVSFLWSVMGRLVPVCKGPVKTTKKTRLKKRKRD